MKITKIDKGYIIKDEVNHFTGIYDDGETLEEALDIYIPIWKEWILEVK